MTDTPAAWTVNIDGHEIPLRITTCAAIGIERATGRTLFQHAEAVQDRSLSIAHLATMLRFLAPVDSPVAALRGPTLDEALPPHIALALGGLDAVTLGAPLGTGDTAEAAILRNGLVDVMARVMVPIVAAMRAGADAAGNPRVAA